MVTGSHSSLARVQKEGSGVAQIACETLKFWSGCGGAEEKLTESCAGQWSRFAGVEPPVVLLVAIPKLDSEDRTDNH